MCKGIKDFFSSHLKSANETYIEHFLFATKLASRIILAGIVLIIHGFIPFIFTKTASSIIGEIDLLFKARKKAAMERDKNKKQ